MPRVSNIPPIIDLLRGYVRNRVWGVAMGATSTQVLGWALVETEGRVLVDEDLVWEHLWTTCKAPGGHRWRP